MSLFKVGDRVRCIRAPVGSGMDVDTIYTVSAVINDMISVGDEPAYWFADRFVLADPVPVQNNELPAGDDTLLGFEGRVAIGETLSVSETRRVLARIRSMKAVFAEARRLEARDREAHAAAAEAKAAEIKRLTERVDELLRANNIEVEARRTAARGRDEMRAAMGRLLLGLAQLQGGMIERGAAYCATEAHRAHAGNAAVDRDRLERWADILRKAADVMDRLPAEAFMEGAS